MDRSLFVRHRRVISLTAGVAFAVFVWAVNGARATVADVFLAVVMAIAFGGAMYLAGGTASRLS